MTYWIPGWLGFGGNLTAGQSASTDGNLSGFDGNDARGGSFMRYNSGIGLSMNGINQAGAFGNIGSLHYDGVQFGYKFPNPGVGLPVTVFAGFDTLKYDAGIGGPFAPFDSTSGTLPGYRAHAGVEFQLAPSVSLSLGAGYTQQPGRIGSDINSLPGVSPFALSGPR